MPPYDAGNIIGQGPWIDGSLNPGPLALVSSGVLRNTEVNVAHGAIADVPALDSVVVTNPWRLDYAVTFRNTLGVYNSVNLYFGNANTGYVGVGLNVGSLLGDSLLHINPDGGFTSGSATQPDPAGKTLLFSLVFDGTNLRLDVDGLTVIGPDVVDTSVIVEPYPDIEFQFNAQADVITIRAVHFLQP